MNCEANFKIFDHNLLMCVK